VHEQRHRRAQLLRVDFAEDLLRGAAAQAERAALLVDEDDVVPLQTERAVVTDDDLDVGHRDSW